ncbi:hypothetical protein [Streptomyces sp. NPDC007074]|uniref:hypothetical protein n=1 Tax=Streptomyces sp. NPDC007074 TaxID=3156764 RepID=UPI0033D09FFA
MTSAATTAKIDPYSLKFIPYWAALDRIVGDAGPMATVTLPRVPGLRMLYDESDAGSGLAEVNDLGRLVIEALGRPYQAELRGQIGIYLADAEGQPADMPLALRDRLQYEVSRARASLSTT